MNISQFAQAFLRGSLVKQVLAGLILGAILGTVWPAVALKFALLGTIFVGALKSVAPILVFILVMAALARQELNTNTNMRPIIVMYILGTL